MDRCACGTGAGFADYRNATGDYVEWRVYAPSAGSYTLTFRYGNGVTTTRPLEIRMNGQVSAASFGFPPTGSWSTWKTVSLAATLQTGLNTVRATAIGSSGPNIDNLSVQPRQPLRARRRQPSRRTDRAGRSTRSAPPVAYVYSR